MKNCSKYCCLVFAFTFTFIFFLGSIKAQNNNPVVSFHYNNTSLKSILTDISKKYQLAFSYSSDNIQAQRLVSLHIDKQPLDKALEQLFFATGILHAKIGDQIVLKPNKDIGDTAKPTQISQNSEPQNATDANTDIQDVDLLENPSEEQASEQKILEETIASAKRQEILSDVIKGIDMSTPQVLSSKPIEVIAPSPIPTVFTNISPTQVLATQTLPQPNTDSTKINVPSGYRLAQASIFPMLGTNTNNPDLINLLSFNLFWGVNGGLEGLELGLFGNSIKRNMNGLQIAGLFNTVGNEINGLQVAGLFNLGAGNLRGVQVSGLWNTAKNTWGMQIAGLFNLSSGDLMGMQVAGFGNISSEKSFGSQYAGFMNVAKDINGTQVAGAVNIAREVNGIQVSGLLNRAKTVRGIQIGIINIVDSIQGIPFGLINIVRKNGYNKIELSAAESMHANFSFKFGAKALYSILELSGHRNFKTWSAGYGLGTFCPMGRVAGINFEIVGAQVNENIYWEQELNLLNQARLTFDFRITRHFSFFFGPTFNVMVSRIYNFDTGQIGSDVPLYHIYNETFNGTNIKMWVGAKAGFRFL